MAFHLGDMYHRIGELCHTGRILPESISYTGHILPAFISHRAIRVVWVLVVLGTTEQTPPEDVREFPISSEKFREIPSSSEKFRTFLRKLEINSTRSDHQSSDHLKWPSNFLHWTHPSSIYFLHWTHPSSIYFLHWTHPSSIYFLHWTHPSSIYFLHWTHPSRV